MGDHIQSSCVITFIQVDVTDCVVSLQALFQEAGDLGVIWGLYLRFKMLGKPQALENVQLQVVRHTHLRVNMIIEESRAPGNVHLCIERVEEKSDTLSK